MKIKAPDTLILLLSILAVFVILTWIIPAGEFERVTTNGRELVQPNTFHEVASNPAGLFDFFTAPIKGFISASQIIVFIFFVAGAFGIINATGAINKGLESFIAYSKNHPASRKLVIPVLMLLFSLAGATFGMSEEVLVFVLITIPMAKALGYDTIVGVSIPFIGAGAGFAGAFLNPFTVGIAQGIAELPPFSGWAYRLIVWSLFTLLAIVYVAWYGKKVSRNNSEASSEAIKTEGQFTFSHKVVLTLLISGIIVLIYGVNQWNWYINEISALFLIMGLISAVISHLKASEAIKAFTEGAAEMIKVAMVVAIAKGILVVATDGKIIDPILYALSSHVQDFPREVSVQLMFLTQTFLNFFLPSGSGQAALTMPIMTPLSDILGITRQTAVLAFQLGDGISNMIIPTSGVTMGVLTLGKIPYSKWVKWALPLIIMFSVLAMLVLIPPIYMQWGPF